MFSKLWVTHFTKGGRKTLHHHKNSSNCIKTQLQLTVSSGILMTELIRINWCGMSSKNGYCSVKRFQILYNSFVLFPTAITEEESKYFSENVCILIVIDSIMTYIISTCLINKPSKSSDLMRELLIFRCFLWEKIFWFQRSVWKIFLILRVLLWF